MKTRLIYGTILALTAFLIVSFSDSPKHLEESITSEEYWADRVDQQDWNSCVQKESSEWGGSCLKYGFSESKYTVHLVNTCDQVVDLMSCVQRENGRWRCFYRMDMKQNDTLHAYDCRGNGKYLKWVRKAGDYMTKFPTLAEVNDQY